MSVEDFPDGKLLASLVDTETIYENAPSGYLSTLPDGTIIRLNRTLLSWLGYDEEEILYKKKFSELLSKGGLIYYEMFFRPMLTINGNVKEFNYEITKKDGTSFPALLNGNGIFDKDGNLQAANIVITDITQRNLYEKELLKAKEIAKSEKERFQYLAETSPGMIWTLNVAGKITFANQKVLLYFGVDRKDLQLKTILSRVYPADKIKLLRRWLDSTNDAKGFTISIRLFKNKAAFDWFEVNVIASQSDTNEIKWFGTCSSINEHIRAMERKDDFINMASHELKTPVTVLQSYLQLMELYPLPDKVRGFVAKSLSTIGNLQFLISSLLNVSLINSGELTLNRSVFSLNDLLQSVLEQLRQTTKIHELMLEMEETPLMVKADRERIAQVVINLVSNAVKYSPGADLVTIKLSYNPAVCKAEISVRDFGNGIPPEDLDKIFERYYRVDVEKGKPGMGLGLYISKSILLAYGSRLKVESEKGKGSTFCFSLPVIK